MRSEIWFVLVGTLACGASTPEPKTGAVADSRRPASVAPEAAPPEAPEPASMTTVTSGLSAPANAQATADAPAAEDDVWQAFHQMPGEDVLRTMRSAQAKVQTCARDGLKRDPSTSGEVKVKFVINQAGNVLAWKDESSSISDSDVVQCIGELIQSLKFPVQRALGNSLGSYTMNVGN